MAPHTNPDKVLVTLVVTAPQQDRLIDMVTSALKYADNSKERTEFEGLLKAVLTCKNVEFGGLN